MSKREVMIAKGQLKKVVPNKLNQPSARPYKEETKQPYVDPDSIKVNLNTGSDDLTNGDTNDDSVTNGDTETKTAGFMGLPTVAWIAIGGIALYYAYSKGMFKKILK